MIHAFQSVNEIEIYVQQRLNRTTVKVDSIYDSVTLLFITPAYWPESSPSGSPRRYTRTLRCHTLVQTTSLQTARTELRCTEPDSPADHRCLLGKYHARLGHFQRTSDSRRALPQTWRTLAGNRHGTLPEA